MLRDYPIRAVTTFALLGLAVAGNAGLSTAPARADTAQAEITFPNSGAAKAQDDFRRGVIALHNFEYATAARAFRAAQAVDPGFVFAYWGEAMTYSHPLWSGENLDAARKTFGRLAPTAAARAAKAQTERERLYLAAVETLFGDGDRRVRHDAYERAMRRLAERFPEDREAAAFHALAILGLDAGEGEADVRDRMRAAALLEDLFRANPRHPGVVHYLIHAYDDPLHAPLGLRAARTYEAIAGKAPHALHMPSHIYIQLGLWEEARRSNRTAYAASAEGSADSHHDSHRDYHSLEWLHFVLLQQGRHNEAGELMEELRQIAKRTRHHQSVQTLLRMTTRAAIEAGAANAEPPEGDPYLDRALTYANAVLAAGLGAAARSDEKTVKAALDQLESLERAATGHGRNEWATKLAVMRGEVAAATHLQAGRREEAFAAIHEAVAREDRLDAPRGPPNPVKPAREFHGEMLLRVDRPASAAAEFEKTLARHARRPAALLGLARAYARLGRTEEAKERYREVQDILAAADPGSTVAEAHAYLSDRR